MKRNHTLQIMLALVVLLTLTAVPGATQTFAETAPVGQAIVTRGRQPISKYQGLCVRLGQCGTGLGYADAQPF